MKSLALNSISKCYRIYNKPEDRFKQSLYSRFNFLKKNTKLYKEHWALRDINFELERGESFGIIGKNGSGKSTLLQIIAGTLFPTNGTIECFGRITALLELGSGFNQNFTGHENIFLNGQILGLSSKEIEEKYDEILSFADIGEFINQPIKTYSSGMLMRLAFAVQTALDPDILIVDEALSVGDMFFQAKCFSRIKKLLNQGITFIFVSHDTGSIQELCKKSIYLEKGKMISYGDTKLITDLYMKKNLYSKKNDKDLEISKVKVNLGNEVNFTNSFEKLYDQNNSDFFNKDTFEQEKYSLKELLLGKKNFDTLAAINRYKENTHYIENVQIIKDGEIKNEIEYGSYVFVRVLMKCVFDSSNINMAVKIRTKQGSNILFMDSRLENKINFKFEKDKYYLFNWRLRMKIMHGEYFVSINLANPPVDKSQNWHFIDVIPSAYKFRMLPRLNGMIDGYYANPVNLSINSIINS